MSAIKHLACFILLLHALYLNVFALTQNENILHLKQKGYFFPKFEKHLLKFPGPKSRLDTIFIVSPNKKKEYPYNKTIIYDELKQYLINIYNSIINQGYPFCEFGKIQYEELENRGDVLAINAYVHVDSGPKVIIHDVRFPGLKHTSETYLKRVIQFENDMPFNTETIRKYILRLKKIDYIQPNSAPEIVKRDTTYLLYLPVKENNLIDFDFILGYAPSDNQASGSVWSGRLFFHFKNLFGGGRRLKIAWEKPDKISENLDLNYQEKFILGTALNANLSFSYRIKDSLFSSNTKGLGLEYPIENLSLILKYSEKNSTLDSTVGVEFGGFNIKTRTVRLMSNYNTMSNPVNPSSGIRIMSSASFGSIEGKNNIQAGNYWSYSLRIEAVHSFFKIFPYFRLSHEKIQSESEIPVSDLLYIGGASSLRGYKEEQFRTDEYYIATLELRFLLSRFSRFHIFRDMGWIRLNNELQQKNAYGIGFLVPMKLGILTIDYGIERGFLLRNGTLHIRMVSDF